MRTHEPQITHPIDWLLTGRHAARGRWFLQFHDGSAYEYRAHWSDTTDYPRILAADRRNAGDAFNARIRYHARTAYRRVQEEDLPDVIVIPIGPETYTIGPRGQRHVNQRPLITPPWTAEPSVTD